MLSILETVERSEDRFFREMWHRLTCPAVHAYMQPVGNTHCLRIVSEQRKGKIDWKMIRSYSLDGADRLLMPVGVFPPEGMEIRRFEPYSFRRRMLENMAMDILRHMDVRPELRRVAVYGQESEVAILLPRLTSAAGEIRVITRREYAIADTAEELRIKNGAAISISDKFDAKGFDILLAPAGGASIFGIGADTLVLSPDRPSAAPILWIKSAVPALPRMLSAVYSEKYDITEFVGAFYEAGEIRELAHIVPEAGITESGTISAEEAAKFINR